MNSNLLELLTKDSKLTNQAVIAGKELAQVHRIPLNINSWMKTSRIAISRAAWLMTELTDNSPSISYIEMALLEIFNPDTVSNLVAIWWRSPLQVLAKIHVLIAAKLKTVDDDLGRPRSDPIVSERLSLLAQLIESRPKVPGAILAGIVHAELTAVAPFRVANDLVALFAARLTAIATGLDSHNLGVPEFFLRKNKYIYQKLLFSYKNSYPNVIFDWLIFYSDALIAGAKQAKYIAQALAKNNFKKK